MNHIKNENIVQMENSFMNDKNSVQLIYELMQTDLQRQINNSSKRLDLSVRKYISWQIFNAVKIMHDHNLVHRDIKPMNILLNEKDHKTKLCDFGLCIESKEYKVANIVSQNTKTMSKCCGTVWYQSPELLCGL